MKLLKYFLLTLTFFFLLTGIDAVSAVQQAPLSAREQLAEIDDQIRELEDIKRGYESRALRHIDQATRLQFEERWNLEYRRHLELAQENEEKAALVQEEIDRLKARRKLLLDQYEGWDGFEDL